MDKPALNPEALYCGPPGLPGVGGQVLDDVIDGVVRFVDNIHNGDGGNVARLKDGVALGVDNGVVGVDLGVDKLLHNVGHVGVSGLQKLVQLLDVRQLVGVGGPHAVVGLDHHRPAHLLDEGHAVFPVVHHVIPGGGDAGSLVKLLHPGLVLDPGHVLLLEAAGNAEVGAQTGVPLQPVLVVALQPVDPAVLVDEEGHRPVDGVVVLQGVHLVVLIEAGLQLPGQLVIGLVADAQHVHPVVPQLPAELPIIGREVGRNKNYV